ncbi:MAG: hypothetical protein HPY59_08745 [Anaerolineae bacterium]|nr:hypothetical protein [Anaerolineae bacterium]
MTGDQKTTGKPGPKPDALCLDFANTMDWHASAQPEESLHRFEDLLQWAEEHNALDTSTAGQMRQKAQRNPAEAEKTLADGIELREAIYRIFSSHAAGESPEMQDLEILNRYLREAMSQLSLHPSGQGYTWRWPEPAESFNRLLWPIARSAAELLTSEWLERVGQCADERGCGWLFLDESRNHKRRWCDMRGCGNRAKARRHYKRSQLARPAVA